MYITNRQDLINECEKGDGESCRRIGRMYNYGRDAHGREAEKDKSKAKKFYKKACEFGSGKGCHELGYMYRYDLKNGLNNSKAVEWFQKACDLGYGESYVELAHMYYYGDDGVEQDASKGVKLYKEACSLGEKAGCSSLGEIYNEAKSDRYSLGEMYGGAKSARYFRKADESGPY